MAKNDIVIWIQHEDGKTPLHFACENDKIEVVECLMKHGAQIDMQDKTVSAGIDAWLRMTLLYKYGISLVKLHFIAHVGVVILKSWNV